MTCLSGSLMIMTAEVRRETSSPTVDNAGTWSYVQDPVSGALIKNYISDDPEKSGTTTWTINCLAKTVGAAGRFGFTQNFGETYENREWLEFIYPLNVRLTKNDRIANIKDSAGNVLWREEELENISSGKFNVIPTEFIVMGTQPVIGPFGPIYNKAYIRRAS